ncbi:MAG TPA: hypothetical protein VFY88_14335 [Intrasporangium sp.]|nr:hypothetical protein [Intrasporangium sp.]
MAIDQRTLTTARETTSRGAVHLSIALAVVAFAAGCLTFLSGFLVGPEVMQGSARGTALMMFLVAAPVLFLAATRTLQGSTRWLLVWGGMTMFLVYNSFMLLTATPINRLFLLYVAAFGLAVATLIAVARSVDADAVAQRCAPAMRVRPIAVYLGSTVVLNALAWLGRIVPATVSDRMPDLVDGMGIATVPTYLQDLALWLPLIAVGAWQLWHRRPWGYVISGATLAFWTLEAATVAVDQWFGHRADPLSDIASDAVVVPFAVLSAITAVVLWAFLRHVAEDPESAAPGSPV